ncbi:hypothetical protein TYRP_023465 [Tyrophagus putrescentiae]|nr:hypothetical protein TYRP_023465 [Tyrophagus putrescentiae]
MAAATEAASAARHGELCAGHRPPPFEPSAESAISLEEQLQKQKDLETLIGHGHGNGGNGGGPQAGRPRDSLGEVENLDDGGQLRWERLPLHNDTTLARRSAHSLASGCPASMLASASFSPRRPARRLEWTVEELKIPAPRYDRKDLMLKFKTAVNCAFVRPSSLFASSAAATSGWRLKTSLWSIDLRTHHCGSSSSRACPGHGGDQLQLGDSRYGFVVVYVSTAYANCNLQSPNSAADSAGPTH